MRRVKSTAMIRHIVLFNARSDADPAKLEEMTEGFRRISSKIPSVKNMVVGKNTSARGSFNMALSCDFETEEDLKAYGPHPEHQRLVHDYMDHLCEAKKEFSDYDA